MRTLLALTLVFAAGLLTSCSDAAKKEYLVKVSNTLDVDRSFETVELSLSAFEFESEGKEPTDYKIIDTETQEELISQVVDSDGTGVNDQILFQPKLSAQSEKTFLVLPLYGIQETKEEMINCYSRFVPERTDDYAWENNRVAFRTFGPVAQQMKEDGVPGGTLTSGIDAWLKRVAYPIINKWYKKELETDGSYHEDDGEGLDNFHVGVSRGVGGIAVKTDSTYAVSKNFTLWKTLYNGPIRTGFTLTYADWVAGENLISEEKQITLDYGSNLSKFEVSVTGVNSISAGLTLHEKDGTVEVQHEQGWASYWQPHGDSELGMAIVVPNAKMEGYEHYLTNEADKSHLYVDIAVDENSEAVYYAGFGWKKSGQFTSKEEWENYLTEFAARLQNPLVVEIQYTNFCTDWLRD